MDGGYDILNDLKTSSRGGVPWMAILDGDGQTLTTSDGPNGNIGCPMKPEEIDHFVEMIKLSSSPTDDELGRVRTALDAYAKKVMAKRNR